MHKELILWSSAVVITFLVGYIYNITDKTYPVSGTIGVKGYKVSYMMEKVHYGPDPFRTIIRTDVTGLTGKIKWRSAREESVWNESALTVKAKILEGEIPFSENLKKVEYALVISYGDKEYKLGGGDPVPLKFFSRVPAPVKFFNGFLIYLILLLAVRTGLEAFSADQKIKKYSFVTAVITLLFTAMIHPLYLSYRQGYINHSVPPVEELFPVFSILFLTVWIVFTIIHFRSENPKSFAAAAMILTIMTYLLVRF